MRHLTPTDRLCTDRQRGFTITELMITVAIVAILLAIGIPSFKYVSTANRMSGEINNLLGDMQLARAAAIQQGQTVTICASTDHATCSGGSAWNTGWIIFGGTGAPSSSNPIIRVQSAFSGSDSLAAGGPTSAVTFNREGFGLNLPAGGVMFTLHESTDNSAYTRCLQATVVGTVSTLNYNGGTCQ